MQKVYWRGCSRIHAVMEGAIFSLDHPTPRTICGLPIPYREEKETFSEDHLEGIDGHCKVCFRRKEVVHMTPKERERAAFLKAIKEASWDNETPRLVYADWLDEHGEEDEATRQRKYVGALKTLIPYADSESQWFALDPDWINDPYRQDEWYKEWIAEAKKEMETYKPDMKRVLNTISYWTRMVEDDGDIHFNDTYPQEALQNPERRAAFWQAFAIVTGVEAPEPLKATTFYSCSC